jgi:hypothetical protein
MNYLQSVQTSVKCVGVGIAQSRFALEALVQFHLLAVFFSHSIQFSGKSSLCTALSLFGFFNAYLCLELKFIKEGIRKYFNVINSKYNTNKKYEFARTKQNRLTLSSARRCSATADKWLAWRCSWSSCDWVSPDTISLYSSCRLSMSAISWLTRCCKTPTFVVVVNIPEMFI